jgi:glutamate-1-semialdehyde 2,1-aminomutase
MTLPAIDRERLRQALRRQQARFAETHPRFAEAYARGQRNLFGGVPMTWMNEAAGGFPLYLDRAWERALETSTDTSTAGPGGATRA